MENIPLKSDLANMAEGLFTKLTQYFETPNTNASQEGIVTRTTTENTTEESVGEIIPQTENNIDTTEVKIVDVSSEIGQEHIDHEVCSKDDLEAHTRTAHPLRELSRTECNKC